jgi:hypothetical protein
MPCQLPQFLPSLSAGSKLGLDLQLSPQIEAHPLIAAFFVLSYHNFCFLLLL